MYKALLLLLATASSMSAQQTKPTTLTITAVPGYSSSPQDVRFFNTGNDKLQLTVGTNAPFALSGNRCGNGVKAHSHCDVWVVYAPQALGTDTGALTFQFNGQTTSVPITGNAVSIINTGGVARYAHKYPTHVLIAMFAEGNIIPNGELVWIGCIDDNGDEVGGSAPLKNNKAEILVDLPRYDNWSCEVDYYGDAEFGPTSFGFEYKTTKVEEQ